MERIEQAKQIALDIDADLYWCPECKAYRKFDYIGTPNDRWLACVCGGMIRKLGLQLHALDHPPISQT